MISFELEEFRPATWSTGLIHVPNSMRKFVRGVSQPFYTGKHVRIYAGEPDPNDGCHFTVRYEIDGVEGVMDGYGDAPQEGVCPDIRLKARGR